MFATPDESLGLYIDVDAGHGLHQLILTGYDFQSTHASHHHSLEEAQNYAAERTGIGDLAWRPWPPVM